MVKKLLKKATAIDNRLSIAKSVQFSCNIMLANIYKNSLFNENYVFNVVNTDIQGKKYNIFLFPLKEKGLTLKTNFMI